MNLPPARHSVQAHLDHVAGQFAAHGWNVHRGEAPKVERGAVVAVMSDPWVEPFPRLADELAAAGDGETLWRVPAISGHPGPQGWDARSGPFTLHAYRSAALKGRGRPLRRPDAGSGWWTGFAVSPAGAAAELLARGWPPSSESVALATGLRLYRYGDPADHDRRELDPFLPDSGGLWVDIGCGSGRLGERLRRADRQVVGIEPDEELARSAATRLDDLLALPAESALARISEPIRCAILADVLEHTTDPAALLRAIRGRLAGDGRLLVSFPNAAWAPVLGALAAGRWDPALAGVQARDHFALFTPASFAELATECGYDVERLEPLPGRLPLGWRIWARLLAWSAGGDAASLAAPQWVAVLTPRAATPPSE